jgi:putative methylase
MQKRLIRKLELEMLLSQIEPHPSPKPNLEQYTIPVDVAAKMLHIAAYTYDDIVDKTILDLGCGTGRLALGAAFLGAKQVVGVDVDEDSVKLAFENSLKTSLKEKIQWISGDIGAIHGRFDTVLENPPFGVQRRKADQRFLEKALEIGKAVYSLHKRPEKNSYLIKKLRASRNNVVPVAPSSFLEKFIEAHGGQIRAVYAMIMTIPYMFSFHTKGKHEFVADLYVIERR